jgi:hypothetical protein
LHGRNPCSRDQISLYSVFFVLGMEMPYKFSLGAKLMPRQQFLDHVRSVRESKGSLLLPTHQDPLNAKSLIDQTELNSTSDAEAASRNAKSNEKHPSPVDTENMPPEKKRPKSSSAS